MFYVNASPDLQARMRGSYWKVGRQEQIAFNREALTGYDVRPFSPLSHLRSSYRDGFANSADRVSSINTPESVWLRGFNPKLTK